MRGDVLERGLGDLADLARERLGEPAAELRLGRRARQLGQRGGDEQEAQVLVVDRDADP